ncbi:MAG: primosomal protein N' [Bacteroidetes bacterium]|nr:primosomal protein N' [Bacteroidota bacterium]
MALPLTFKYHSGGFDGLTYSIPEELAESAQVGTRVVVPLGKRLTTGVIVARSDEAPKNIRSIRAIEDILDTQPVFDEHFLAWTKWIAGYYLSSWGEVLEAALPQGLRSETKSKVIPVSTDIAREAAELEKRSMRRAEVLRLIATYPNGVFASHLAKRSKIGGLYAHLAALERDGFIRIVDAERPAAKPKTERVAVLTEELEDGAKLTRALLELENAPKQARVLMKLMQQRQLSPDEPLAVKLLSAEAEATPAVIQALVKKNYVRIEQREVRSTGPSGPLPNHEDAIENLALTSDQQIAVDAVNTSLDAAESKTFLIHGITGSGKTEVYITLARKVIASGGGVLVLVPEISLTPQLIDRFKRRLHANISVLHSRMSNTERLASWQALARGDTKIAIGARSAVFAPIRNLKLIIVDEEHEVTYKQYDSSPRYHARDAAVMRAHLLGGVAVLGSATPSLESFYNAEQKKYTLLQLTKRAQDAKLPPVRIVDMRQPLRRAAEQAKASSISPELKEAIALRLARKQGVVLLQNRRGFSTFLGCSSCGEVVMCPNCAVTMTWHQSGNRMQCHYCGFLQKRSQVCPTCGSEKMYLGGVGTERVEDELRTHFPEIRIARMDLDTTSRRGAYEQLLRSFGNGDADVLLGTQMVAKGLDFPRVTLVGVINADTSLSLPDFRSAERTFQLLTQVSGRAGRSEELAGEVIVQTFQPEHPAVLFAAKHDYEGFYAHEHIQRHEPLYPPYVRLILVEFRGENAQTVAEKARAFTSLVPAQSNYYQLLGPVPPPIARLRGEFRQHLLIKDIRAFDPGGEKIRRMLAGALELYQERFATRSVSVTVDVDVQGVL